MSTVLRKRVWYWSIVVCGLLCLTPAPVLAAPISTITLNPLQFSVNGTPTDVGTLTATLSDGRNSFANDNQITATVNLNAPFADYGTFHWVQVITSANPNAANGTTYSLAYNGKPLDSSKANNPLPIIDVPNPNYDGKPPDDNLPWYLTLAEEGGSNPGFGGNTINGDGSATYKMIDQPLYGGLTFDTFFVAETGANSFGVIAEFSWGYGSTGGASTLVPGPMDNFLPDANAIAEINSALTNGGFNGWSAQLGYNAVTPEPGSWVLLVSGAGVALIARRMRWWGANRGRGLLCSSGTRIAT